MRPPNLAAVVEELFHLLYNRAGFAVLEQLYVVVYLMSRTQSISVRGTPAKRAKPVLLVVLKYRNLKLREEEKRNSGLRTGLYNPLRVTCCLRTVC